MLMKSRSNKSNFSDIKLIWGQLAPSIFRGGGGEPIYTSGIMNKTDTVQCCIMTVIE